MTGIAYALFHEPSKLGSTSRRGTEYIVGHRLALLGTEGEAYHFLRRHGAVAYFGFGYLA